MIEQILSTDDRVLVVHQKLHKPITVTTEYSSFHCHEYGLVDTNLIRLIDTVNHLRRLKEQQDESEVCKGRC